MSDDFSPEVHSSATRMKQLARLFTALFLIQTLAHPAQATLGAVFYKLNSPAALAHRAQPAINSGVIDKTYFQGAGTTAHIKSGGDTTLQASRFLAPSFLL